MLKFQKHKKNLTINHFPIVNIFNFLKLSLFNIEKRLTGWQLKSFKESYKHKIENGLSLFKKRLMESAVSCHLSPMDTLTASSPKG